MKAAIKSYAWASVGFIFAAALFIGAGEIVAWTSPTGAPPAGNVASPINAGPTNQDKEGGLSVGGAFSAFLNSYFAAQVGIGSTSPAGKLGVQGSIFASDIVKWGAGRGTLKTDNGASLELGGSGTPYIDFSNDANPSNDYDARLVLTGDDTLELLGANLVVNGQQVGASSGPGIGVRSGRLICSGGTVCTKSVSFDGAFTSTPHIMLSLTGYKFRGPCRNDDFKIDLRITAKSAAGFTASAPQGDYNGGCGGFEVVEMSWLAIGESNGAWVAGDTLTLPAPSSPSSAEQSCYAAGNYWNGSSCISSGDTPPSYNPPPGDDDFNRTVVE